MRKKFNVLGSIVTCQQRYRRLPHGAHANEVSVRQAGAAAAALSPSDPWRLYASILLPFRSLSTCLFDVDGGKCFFFHVYVNWVLTVNGCSLRAS